ncbi:MAG: serine/threonine protein kinase, partial [Myxococcota bacterium]
RAFERDDDTRTMEAIVNDPLPRPERIAASLWAVLSRALAKHPQKRPRTALQLAQELAEVVAPAADAELAQHVSARFAWRLREYERWSRLAEKTTVTPVVKAQG